MAYIIETGIPIDKQSGSGGQLGELSKTLMRMNVGDSVLVGDKAKAKGISSAAKTAKKHTGYSYVTRSVEGGTRVWRVE